MKPLEKFPLPVWSPPGDEADPLARRDFLKLLGTSVGVVSGACAKPPEQHLTARGRQPEHLVAGRPQHYATCRMAAGIGVPLLVTARDGRPVKIDGNPDHRATQGACGPQEQAELAALYDPHRPQGLQRGGQPATKKQLFDTLARLVAKLSKRDGGRTVRFLCEPSSSPWLTVLKARILEKLPNMRFVSWAPLAQLSRYEGARIAFGRPLEALYDFSKARVVVALDHDFLSGGGPDVSACRGWAERRTPDHAMGRLYVVEPSLTVTGTVADHRLRVKGSAVESVLRALVAEVAKLRPALLPLAAQAPRLDAAKQRFIAAVAKDLVAAGREALVTAGDRQPPAVHALALALTSELGGMGHTASLVSPALADTTGGPLAFKTLADELASGQVDVLVITAPNPAAFGYANIDFAGLLRRAGRGEDKAVIYLGAHPDETSRSCEWFVPEQHFLETWGDARALDGSYLFQQPLIEPLYRETVSEAQLFAAFVGDGERAPLELLLDSWKRRQAVGDDPAAAAAFHAQWERWLQLGFVPNSAAPLETAALDLNSIALAPQGRPVDGIELALVPDYKVSDGRFANSAWLHELPDPITKLVWDNAALVSPATANRLGLVQNGLAKLTVSGRGLAASVIAPVFVLPGHADDTVTLALGYGRDIGVDAYALRHADAVWFTSVEVARADGSYPLVTTQEHGSMEGRELALELPLAQLGTAKRRLAHLNGAPAAYDPKGPHRWAMAIDLNRCTGCSACVTACQAENNIPTVGKKQVARKREMHWLRIDRYFSGDGDDLKVITQPVTCQHCEDAPCERACPVGATPHSDEGLNQMVYERCVGSRACARHCPYQVRRFNYLDSNGGLEPVERLRANPDVTVRARGVMEKCTFCVQRIERARAEGPQLPDGAVRTACQQACPTGAIAFGSLHDPTSEVSRWHRDGRRYDFLHELGTRPRTAFLARIKNPNPELQ